MPLGVVLFRLFLSSLLGAIVGVEREIQLIFWCVSDPHFSC